MYLDAPAANDDSKRSSGSFFLEDDDDDDDDDDDNARPGGEADSIMTGGYNLGYMTMGLNL
jgi:hypothetical protein